MRILFGLILISAMCSCVFFNQTTHIAGTYKYEEKAGRDYGYVCQIVLREDSTFEFAEDGHMVHSKSSGRWHWIDGTVVLSSYKQHGIKAVSEDNNSKGDSVEVRVVTHDSVPLVGAVVIINDDTVHSDLSNAAILNKDGIAHFKRQEVHLITVSMIDKYVHTTRSRDASRFIITVVLSEPAYQYFDSAKWKIEKNKLFRDSNFVLKRVK